MEDIGLVKQGWKWVQSRKIACSHLRTTVRDHHWPLLCNGFKNTFKFVVMGFVYWMDCFKSGFGSLIALQSAALLVIMWSCFLSLTSLSCLLYVLLSLVSFFFSYNPKVSSGVICYILTPFNFIIIDPRWLGFN